MRGGASSPQRWGKAYQHQAAREMAGFGRYDDLMQRLGKHRTGKSCLYLTKLEDADPEVLETMIRDSVARMEATWK